MDSKYSDVRQTKQEIKELCQLREQIERLEEKLGDNANRFKEVQEMAQLGHWKWNIETGEVNWTIGIYNIFHLDPETFTPQIDSIMAMSPWEDTKNRHLEVMELLTGGSEKHTFEQRFLRPDGSIGYYISTFNGEFNETGKLTHIKGVLQDISERKITELALQKSEEKYRLLFETMAQGVVYQDRDGRITSANPSSERILGLSLDQMRGRTSKDPRWRTINEDRTDFDSDLHPSMLALRTGKPVIDTVMGVYNPEKKDYSWININAVPQFLPGEDIPFQVYTTFEDITRRKLADEAIKNSERLLKETNASKDRLFSIISHDLRSPFQSILGYSEMFSKEYNNITDEQRLLYLEEINNSSQKAYFLLDNLLKWAQEQQGRIVINKEKLNVEHLITESISPYLSLARKKSINVVNDIQKDITLTADENTIRTVIGNLVSNAIKFTRPNGRITIRAIRKKDSVDLIISDSGIGMKQKIVDGIFNTNECQSTTGTNNEIGTGLGLQLCKEFIRKNDGVLQIKSQEGKGSSFIISLRD